MEAIGLILGGLGGLAIGALVSWIVKGIKDKSEVKKAKDELFASQTKVVELTKKLAEVEQKYVNTQSLLANTLAAMEILKAYQTIDTITKKQIEELKNTFVDGKASDATMEKYNQMIEKMNEQFATYNEGKKQVVTKTTAKKQSAVKTDSKKAPASKKAKK